MSTNLSPESFFDFSDFDHREVFSGCKFVWEVLPNIESYIAGIFQSGKIRANYGKDIYLGEETEVEPGVYIKGPAIIGRSCHIGHAAYLRENVLIADNCVIGHGTEIKNSIFLPGSAAAHLNYVGDSILGNKVNVAAGALLPSFRLDGKPVIIKIDNQIYDTKLPKFGAVIGDGTKIGVNSVLNPGTLLGKNCAVYPLTSVRGYHPAESVIR